MRYGNVHRRTSGFTLIELLVVTLILGVVLTVIGACLAAGIRVWDETQRFNKGESEATIAFQMMQKDLMNAFRFYGISFVGQRNEMSFAGLIFPGQYTSDGTKAGSREDSQKRIGTVKYSFSANGGELMRSQWVYPCDESSAGRAEKVESGLSDVSLEYCSLTPGSGGGPTWHDSWNEATNLPVAVRINLSLADGGDHPVQVSRTVVLAVGGVVPP